MKEETAALSQKANYKVPFGTVSITEEARDLINEAITSKWLTRGKYVQEFEERFAAIFGVKHAIAVSSGTDADAICCAVLYDFGAERGDEVIVPALSFVATGNAVLQAGLTPVFVDVKRETLNIDPDKIEAVITEKTRAIMPVHLMGKPAAMEAIGAIAKKHDLMIIEDTAEAHGARYHGKMCGTIGDMAAFSLYAAHIITSIEGGMIITDNDKIADAARSLRNHGIEGKFRFKRIGFSAKMNEIEAAVGVGNIKMFDDILNKRRDNLLYLIQRFAEFSDAFYYIQEDEGEVIGPHAFSAIVKEGQTFTKDDYVAFLDGQGIDSRNLFYSMPTQTESYAYMGFHAGDFPEAEFCSNNGTHFGIHQDLNRGHMDHIVAVTEKFLEKVKQR